MTDANNHNQDPLNAAFTRAQSHLIGDGVPQPSTDALHWFMRAAHQGHAEAAYRVGQMYHTGEEGIEANVDEAVRWYKVAAKLGHIEAMMVLGVTYEMGKVGVPVDKVAAHVYYSLAKARGRETVDDLLAGLEKSMSSVQVKEARRLFQAMRG